MKKGDKIHFIGVGGVSMSGIAMELARQGFIVTGSDVSDSSTNSYLKEIEKLGQIKLFKGHSKEFIENDVNAVVITSTINKENPELLKAQELKIKILERFEAINLIVKEFKHRIGVFGGAGKTTTTALTFFLFQNAALLPSLFLGSVMLNLKSSVHLENNKKFCIFETDESDASFEKMSLNAGIFVTMENDHLEHKKYSGSYDVMKQCFKNLLLDFKINNKPLCYNEDSLEVKEMVEEILKDYPLKKSFSIKNKNASFYVENFSFVYGGMSFDVFVEGKLFLQNLFMPLIGEFNGLNVASAMAMLSFYAPLEIVKFSALTLKNFEGIDKRQALVGKFKNFDIIDDYAHSPVKIKAMLSGFYNYANSINAEIVPICEIHKYSRFSMLYEEFLNSFTGIPFVIFIEVYAVPGYAGERPDIQTFIEKLKLKSPNTKAIFVKNENLTQELFAISKQEKFAKKQHNFFLFFGAGRSSVIAKQMQASLEAFEQAI